MDKNTRLQQFLYIRERMKNVPIDQNPFNVFSIWDINSDDLNNFKTLLKQYVNLEINKLNNKIHIKDINKYLYYKIIPYQKPELILRNI